MDKLGIQETPKHKKMLLDHFDEVAKKYDIEKILPDEGFGVQFVKHSYFTGPSGFSVKFETTFQISNDNLRFITTIPKY